MTLPPADLARRKMTRTAAAQAADEWVTSHLWRFEDGQVKDLYQMFLDTFAQLSQRLVSVFMNQVNGDTWSMSDPGARQRTEGLLAAIDAQIGDLLGQAQDAVFAAAYRAYQAGAVGRAWVLDQLVAAGVDIPLLPAEAIRAALLLPYESLTTLDRFANARAEFEMLVRKAIVQSQIAGESIAQATRRLRDALGIKRGDPRALFARTEMIARTEILRSSNMGAMATYENNKDVLQGWTFTATHDERTCPICGALDGQNFEFGNAQQLPPLHPNCRCTAVPWLKDQALSDEIAGKRETYVEWAARRGVSIVNDGGVLKFKGA